MKKLSFDDFAGLNTARANRLTLHGAFDVDFDRLKIGEKSTKGFSDDLGTRAAGSFDLSASFIFNSGNSTFATNETYLHEITSF